MELSIVFGGLNTKIVLECMAGGQVLESVCSLRDSVGRECYSVQ